MNYSHLFSEHPMLDDGNLRQAGPIQYMLHWLYGVFEPPILRAVDILLTRKWIKDTNLGRFLLKQIARLSWYFPHGLIVTTEAAGRMVDFVINIEGPKGARIAVGPCVCQRSLGIWQEPCKKDMVVLYGADIYTHLNLGYELIDGDQAKALLKQYADAGLVHSIDFCMQSGKWTFVICSCDTEICIPARVYLLTGRFLYPGPEEVRHNVEKCVGTKACGRCITRCLFGSNQGKPDGSILHNSKKCLGCGLCASTCVGKARTMIPRPDWQHENVITSRILLGENRIIPKTQCKDKALQKAA